MPYSKILIGVLAGLAVGAVNFFILRASVKLAVRNAGGALAPLIIIGSYALRYLLIGVVVFSLMKRGESVISLTVLGVLGILTVLLAVWQQRKKNING